MSTAVRTSETGRLIATFETRADAEAWARSENRRTNDDPCAEMVYVAEADALTAAESKRVRSIVGRRP